MCNAKFLNLKSSSNPVLISVHLLSYLLHKKSGAWELLFIFTHDQIQLLT